MDKLKYFFILLLAVPFFLSCNQKRNKAEAWVWSHARKQYSTTQWDSALTRLHDAGINSLLLSADSGLMARVLPLAKRKKIAVHAWIWTMNRADAPENWMSVNALGQSLANEKAYVEYYKFMCPAIDSVYPFIMDKFRPFLQMKDLAGIHMDYIRYVDVILPEALQPKYGLVQTDVMPQYDYGYHPVMLEKFAQKYGYAPYEVADYAHDSIWLSFRLEQLNRVVNRLAQTVNESGKMITAAVFPEPALSVNMVRQQWDHWKLDAFFPMVYYNFYNRDVNWLGEIIQADVQQVGQPIYCGLYLPGIASDTEFEEAIIKALESGAKGVSFFEMGGLTDNQLRIIKKYFGS